MNDTKDDRAVHAFHNNVFYDCQSGAVVEPGIRCAQPEEDVPASRLARADFTKGYVLGLFVGMAIAWIMEWLLG